MDASNDPKAQFSPREILRARRPELFSDSTREESSKLDRPLLEYHLDSLTSRSQELDFEKFARQLAVREVCPNLRPHTGPTGGGDSKVDTETYPVAESLTFAWFLGDGGKAGSERWGFAFSTKADWRSKLQSDLKEIAKTKRGYTKVFFVSSRFVADKLRANLEDELSKKYRFKVVVLDRNWILDRVFAGHHQDLAESELKLTGLGRTTIRKGPQDLEGEQQLVELEKRITEAALGERFDFSYVADCIEAAKISRGLELPRIEIDGRFARARRSAEKFGSKFQRLMVAYQEAWTTYWWFEDFAAFASLYADVEQLVSGTENIYELELNHNLWTILFTLTRVGKIDPAMVKIEERTARLAGELDRLSKLEGRPSAALNARELRLLQLLCGYLASGESDKVAAVLKKLKGVVRESVGLVGFPLESLVEIVTELGNVVGTSQAYDELFEVVVSVSATRDGDVSAARLMLKRAEEQLRADHAYDAIRTLGRILSKLYNHESRVDLVRALLLSASAYQEVGLLWAAHGTMVVAASIATSDFWTYSDVTMLQAECYNRLKWLELRLGRLPHLLAWHELDNTVRQALHMRGFNAGRLAQGERAFDVITGILLLKADLWQLKQLCRLPDLLGNHGLMGAAVALLYALGDVESLPKDLREDKSEEGRKEFFAKWRDQPAAKDLPETPQPCDGTNVILSSRILGCRINVHCSNRSPATDLAESILAAMESLLSTGQTGRLMAREPNIEIEVRIADFAPYPFAFEITDAGGQTRVKIDCREFNPHTLSVEEQGTIKEQIQKLLVSLLARYFVIDESMKGLAKLVRDERALERAINFTGSFVALGNVLGQHPKLSLSDWVKPEAKEYSLTRLEEWDQADREKAKQGSTRGRGRPIFGIGESPPVESLPDVSHAAMETFSVIRESLWNRARWTGTAYYTDDDDQPPCLALGFKDGAAAEDIFTGWRKEIGPEDRAEKIRITILRGIKRGSPYAYRIAVGPNPEAIAVNETTKRFNFMSRMHLMEPSSPENLERFLQAYRKWNAYILCYGVVTDDPSITEVHSRLSICKREISIMEAWEVGRDNPAAMALSPDDDPIIPAGKSDAPVVEILKWMRERGRSLR